MLLFRAQSLGTNAFDATKPPTVVGFFFKLQSCLGTETDPFVSAVSVWAAVCVSLASVCAVLSVSLMLVPVDP